MQQDEIWLFALTFRVGICGGGGVGVVSRHMLEAGSAVPLLLAPRHLPDHDYRMWFYSVKEFL